MGSAGLSDRMSDELAAKFEEDGFIIVPGMFSPEEMRLLGECVANDERSFTTDGSRNRIWLWRD